MSGPLAYLLVSWGVITFALVVLIAYRAVLASKEDDKLYINQAEEQMMASNQPELIQKMNRLARPIIALSVASGVLLLATAGVWVWIGLKSS